MNIKYITHITQLDKEAPILCMVLFQIHFYFDENLFDVGPHQSPFIFVWINFVNSITKNYEK